MHGFSGETPIIGCVVSKYLKERGYGWGQPKTPTSIRVEGGSQEKTERNLYSDPKKRGRRT